jgi:diguanylate cyclase
MANHPSEENGQHRFPPLTVSAAQRVIAELEAALDAHRGWAHRFQAMLVCRTKPSADQLAADSHLWDPFGRWYHRRASDFVRQHPHFPHLGDLHEAVHAAARPLARAVAANRRITSRQFNAFQDARDRLVYALADILEEARELLRHTDPLTGIANRFAMLPILSQERERVRRTGIMSSVCMADLDRFKLVNDSLGHQAGDKVLYAVARYLLDNIRRYDQVCRYGGEEFLILLPSTDPEKAKKVLDRLRRGLSRQNIQIDETVTISVTASFGVAALEPEDSLMSAIDHADQAMYEAKAAGRNRVRIWHRQPVPA